MFMDEIIMLVAGAIAGCSAALAGGGLVIFLHNRVSRLRNEKRERIISFIEEKWLEADGIIISYRTGQITADAFRQSLLVKIGDINRRYKPNLHQLDIFFVKYTERLIDDYNRMIETADGKHAPAPVLMSSPVSSAPEEQPVAEEVATVVFKEEAAINEPPIEQPVIKKQAVESGSEAPIAESAASVPATEEEIVSAMAEVSQSEEELPLETFLEMKTLAGTEEAIGAASPPEDRKKPVELLAPDHLQKEKSSAHVTRKEPALPSSDACAEETIVTGRPSLQPPEVKEASMSEGKPSEEEETMAGAAVSFPVRIPVVPPAVPAFSREEVAQPATIYDIEAETIIADRNELINTPKAAEQHADKSNLGITGDDVSDMLDKFFGGK
jgi:hypothetical protein